MSSYLTIYGKLKGTDKYIPLSSHSRSSEIYQSFREEINPAFIESDPKYTKLSSQDVLNMINSIKENIRNAEEKINEYEKHACGNEDIILEIIEMKHYVNDLKELLGQIWQVYYIVDNTEYNSDSKDGEAIDGIYCNVD